MKYKGYIGHVTYDDHAKIFHGDVIGLQDVITFQGKSVDELEQAFKDSIDDYLSFCETLGKEPQKVYSGELRIRINPSIHAKLAQEAQKEGKSLNTIISEKLSC